MLYVSENFLSNNQCKELIELYKNNLNLCYQHRSTFPMRLIDFTEDDDLVNFVNSKVIKICSELFSGQTLRLENYEIVKWATNSNQKPHYDNGDKCAAIIYLNDDFIGGKTCFDFGDIVKIAPETGKCLIFSNSKYLHWVEEVKTNSRYTLSYWFI